MVFLKAGEMAEQIHLDLLKAHDELRQWIIELGKAQSEQQKELLLVLKTMETDMADNLFIHINSVQDSLSIMEESYLLYIEEIKNEMGESFIKIDTTIHDQFINQKTEFNNQFKELNVGTGEQIGRAHV